MNTAAQRPPNIVGDKERIVSALAGSLLVFATTRKHTVNTLLLLGGGYLLYRAVTGRCVVSEAISRGRSGALSNEIKVRTHFVVNRPRPEVYAFWRRLENLPLFMTHLEHVDELDQKTSAWRLQLPGGGDIRWEARMIKDERDTELSWHSVEGAAIRNTGKINFSDTPGKGTRIDAMVLYGVQPGPIGDRIAAMLTPSFQRRVEEDIHRYKEYLETELHAH